MARPRQFTDEDVVEACEVVVGERGSEAKVEDVAARLGVSAGAVYHRVGTRQAMLVRLWLRSLSRFHERFLHATTGDDADEALAAGAVSVVEFCRAERAAARSLTLFRWHQLRVEPPAHLAEQVEHANDELDERMRDLVRRRLGRDDERSRELVALAVRTLPYSLVRPRLDDPGAPIPAWIDDAVRAGARAIVATGDRSPCDGLGSST